MDLARKPEPSAFSCGSLSTPVLVADGQALFESAVICEYLDETQFPRLHPQDPLQRARHRAWMAFGSSMLDTIAAFYAAPDAAALERQRAVLVTRFAQLEQQVDPAGPFFAGPAFSVVDAVFAPVFRYFDTFESVGEPDFFTGTPRMRAWRAALSARPSVRQAAVPDYPQLLRAFLLARGGELSRRIQARA